MDEGRQPGLGFGQIMLVEAVFRHRDDYLSVPATTRAAGMSVLLEARTEQYNEGDAAGVSLRVYTDPNDKELLYQFSVQVAAVVTKQAGKENMPPSEYVVTAGTSALFPFLREALANLTMRGRFGPIWLNPINPQLLIQQAERLTP
jgi:preprotein translocase subunit SecB